MLITTSTLFMTQIAYADKVDSCKKERVRVEEQIVLNMKILNCN